MNSVKPFISITVEGKGYRNIATAVEEYARECGLMRMHGDRFSESNPDFSRVGWVEFPFENEFESVQQATEALRAKCRRPDIALVAKCGKSKWIAMAVAH